LFLKGFRVLGFGPLNARLARIEGMMGYLNRCKTLPFCLIMDASLSAWGDRARKRENTWLFSRRAFLPLSKNAATSCTKSHTLLINNFT